MTLEELAAETAKTKLEAAVAERDHWRARGAIAAIEVDTATACRDHWRLMRAAAKVRALDVADSAPAYGGVVDEAIDSMRGNEPHVGDGS